MDNQEKLDHIRMEKLIRRGWVLIKADTLMYENRYLMFIRKEEVSRLRGYPKNSAIFKHTAEFVYDTVEKKFIKKSVEINVSKAEEILYGRS